MVPVFEVVWWWGAAVGVWVLTLSSVPPAELAVAAACGLPCALAARAARTAFGGAWRPRVRWLRWLAVLPITVVKEATRVLWFAFRPPWGERAPGELRSVMLPEGEPGEVAAAREALAVMVLSSTPGTFVVDTDPEERRLVVHSLLPGRSPVEEVIGR